MELLQPLAVDVIDVASDKCHKINTIVIANIDGSSAADITIQISTDNGSNYYAIASTFCSSSRLNVGGYR